MAGSVTPNESNAKEPLYLEDLRVGRRFVTGTHLIDEEQIKAFAQEFDPQPFHLDEDAAKDSFFQGLVASGWHTGAVSMRLLVESGLAIAGGLIGASVEVNWPQPTRPGSIIHLEIEIMELRPSKSRPERGLATIRGETRNQFGEVVQVMTAKLMVPRRNVSPEGPTS